MTLISICNTVLRILEPIALPSLRTWEIQTRGSQRAKFSFIFLNHWKNSLFPCIVACITRTDSAVSANLGKFFLNDHIKYSYGTLYRQVLIAPILQLGCYHFDKCCHSWSWSSTWFKIFGSVVMDAWILENVDTIFSI